MKKEELYMPHLSSLLDTAKINLWEWDVLSEQIEFFGRLDCFGRNNVQKISLSKWKKHIHPDDIDMADETFKHCIEGKENSYLFHIRIRTIAGGWVWVQESGNVTRRDKNGRAVTLMGTQQDVSRLKMLTEKFEDLSQHIDIIADLSGQAYWTLDTDTQELVFSSQFETEFGYAPGELRQTLESWMHLIHPDDQKAVQKALSDYLEGKSDYYRSDRRIKNKHGRYVWVAVYGRIVQWLDGKPKRLAGGLTNIDHIKTTEQALQKALDENEFTHKRLREAYRQIHSDLKHSKEDLHKQRLLLQIVNTIATQLLLATDDNFDNTIIQCLKNMGEGVFADRVYIMQNTEINGQKACAPLYQWTLSEENIWETGKVFPYTIFGSWYDRLEQNECINYHVQDIEKNPRVFFEKLGIQSLLILPITIDNHFWGTVYLADSNKVRLSDEPELKTLQSGGILIALSIMRYHAMQRLSSAMQRAQASSHAKTLFLANMSHELRTPMNAIIGMTENIRHSPKSASILLDYIDDAAKKLLGLIENVLEMSNIELDELNLKQEPFSLQDLLDEVIDTNMPVIKDKFQHFHSEPCEAPTLLGDAPRLKTVLNHILMNAVKYTPDEGSISLHTKVSAKADDKAAIEIIISDTGPGLDADSAVRIFQVFEQRDNCLSKTYEGAGLGLSLAKGIITKMDGELLLDTSPGNGCIFTIHLTFPLAKNQDAPEDASAFSKTPPDFTGRHALLVDDNEINRMVCLAMLEQTGIQTDEAEDGLQAVQMVEAQPDRYDIILMDIHMPVMDGYEAARGIHAIDTPDAKNIPIIAVTANTFEKDIERSTQAGMSAHVAKPLEANLLWQTIKQHIKK